MPKNYNNPSKINSANNCADSMLTRINECFQDSIKSLPKIKSAVVSAVNDDGTVNVYFPPNDKKLFTRISNQGPFALQVGDGVELMLKNGTFDNCWVIAKHGINRNDINVIQNNNLLVVDSIMNTASTNALQNKVITQEINALKLQIASLTQQIEELTKP